MHWSASYTTSPSTQTTLTPSKSTKQSFTLFNSAYTSSPSTQTTLTPSKLVKHSSTLFNSPSNIQWSATSSPHIVLNDGINPTTKNEISFLLIALIAAIIIALLILIVVIVISFCLCRKCYHSRNLVWTEQGEFKDKIMLRNAVEKGISDNSRELHPIDPNIFSVFTQALSIAVPNSISSLDNTYINEEMDQTFTISYRELSMPNLLLGTEDNVPVVPPKSLDLEKYLSTLSAFDFTDSNSQNSQESMDIDSKVQKRMIPTMKSSDLESYLASLSAINEGVYCEPFTVSDFTDDGMEVSEAMGEESDLQICAPIYTVPSTLTEAAQGQVPINITTDNFKEVKKLGIGQFGQVILASASGLSLKGTHLSKESDEPTLVVMKKLKPHLSQIDQKAFIKERNFMSQLSHPNVLRFLGACSHDPAFIMEYTTEGDLHHFLQRYTDIVSLTTPSNSTQISTSTIVYMASQIASAMQYLAQQKFIHRDLATRNCLVGENFTIKVADLGVNLDRYQSHYYKIQGNRLLPIRWMATECFDGKFSEKSDIWAFGITLWELFTLSKDKPYPNLSDEDVIKNALMRQYRQFPSRPTACPPAVYEIMHKCWIINLCERATFEELNVLLQNAYC